MAKMLVRHRTKAGGHAGVGWRLCQRCTDAGMTAGPPPCRQCWPVAGKPTPDRHRILGTGPSFFFCSICV